MRLTARSQPGFSLTSFSLKDVSLGSGAVAKAPMCRVAGCAGSCGAKNCTSI